MFCEHTRNFSAKIWYMILHPPEALFSFTTLYVRVCDRIVLRREIRVISSALPAAQLVLELSRACVRALPTLYESSPEFVLELSRACIRALPSLITVCACRAERPMKETLMDSRASRNEAQNEHSCRRQSCQTPPACETNPSKTSIPNRRRPLLPAWLTERVMNKISVENSRLKLSVEKARLVKKDILSKNTKWQLWFGK